MTRRQEAGARAPNRSLAAGGRTDGIFGVRLRASGLLGGGSLEDLAQTGAQPTEDAVQDVPARQIGQDRLAPAIVLLQLVQDARMPGLQIQALLERLEGLGLQAVSEVDDAEIAVQVRVEELPLDRLLAQPLSFLGLALRQSQGQAKEGYVFHFWILRPLLALHVDRLLEEGDRLLVGAALEGGHSIAPGDFR